VTSDNVGIGNDGATTGSGTGSDPAGANVTGLSPSDGGSGGGNGGVDPGTQTVAVTTEPSDQPISIDANHDGGLPGDNTATANLDLGSAVTLPGGSVNNGGDTTNNIANNIINSGSETTGSGGGAEANATAGGGGGGVEIGGFSGAYAAGAGDTDWRARCALVFKDPKKYTKRVWNYCHRLVQKEKPKPQGKPANAAPSVGPGPG
jgi:hypothetical protein